MARVVCQTIHRPGRISILWSEGGAAFEPYHLEGAALEAFYENARQARQRLATVASGANDDAGELATIGYQLYRSLFQLDANDPAAQAVHQWWQNLVGRNSVTSLEMVSDRPGCVPWNVVYDEAPDAGPGSAARQHFWGFRFALGVGRRVSPHRVFPYLDKPTLLVAVDSIRESELPSEENRLLAQLIAERDAQIVRSFDALTESLRQQAPDVLVILCRVERGRLLLGDGGGSMRDVRQALAEADAGNPQPIVLFLGSAAADAVASWECFLGGATSELSSVIGPETPGTPTLNLRAAVAWLHPFLSAQADAATALQQTRQQLGLAGLAYSAFCPPYVRVLVEGAEPEGDLPAPALQRLPAKPYRGLAPFDREDRALFLGREDDAVRCARLLDEAGTRGVLLHGAAAVGKASFLRAGVLPYLEDEALGYLALRDRSETEATQAERDYPTLALRATGDLSGQLSAALAAFCAQPFTYGTPSGATVTIDLPNLIGEPGDIGEPRGVSPRVLDDITRSLPFELVIVVEQAEDLLADTTPLGTKRRHEALALLAELSHSPIRCKIVLSLRTEFFGRLSEGFSSPKDRMAWREFFLSPLSAKVLTEALLAPTATEPTLYANSAPHQQYRLAFAPGVMEKIVADAEALAAVQQVSAVALCQAACEFLVQQARERQKTLIQLTDLRELRSAKDKPIDTALKRYVEQRLGALPVSYSAQRSVRILMGKLHVRQEDGSLTRPLIPVRELVKHWRGGDTLENAVNAAARPEAGLLEVQQAKVGGREGLFVGLAHDGLASWSARQTSDAERRSFARSKVIDALFVLVPLMVLAVAVTYYLMRGQVREQSEEAAKLTQIMKKELEPALVQLRAESQASPAPLYAGALAQADQALRAGNVLRARQHLLGQQPYSIMEREELFDRRGFEWRYLWRQANPERHTLLGHRGLVHAVAASPDNALLATAGADHTVRLWNLKRQGEVATIYTGHQGPVLAVAFAPDGKSLASAGLDSVVHIWDVKIGIEEPLTIDQPHKQLVRHKGAIHALTYGTDANTLITAGADKTVLIWDLAKGDVKATLKDHSDELTSLTLTADGKSFASAGKDGSVIVWTADGSKKITSVKAAGPVNSVAFAPDGSVVASGCIELQAGADVGTIQFWDASTGKEAAAPIVHGAGLFGIAFKPNSGILVSAGKDHAVRAWDMKTGKEQLALRGHLGWVQAVALTPNGATVATSSHDNTVRVWDWTAPSDVLTHGDWVQALAFSGDNELLASGGRDGVVKIWKADSSELVGEIKGQTGPITALAFTGDAKDRKLIVGAFSDKEGVKIWNVTIALRKLVVKEGPTFAGHTGGVQCLAVSKNQLLATGSADGTAILWDLATGQKKHTLAAEAPVHTVAFSPSGGKLATGDRKGEVRLWQTATGQQERGGGKGVSAHVGGVHAFVFRGEDYEFLSAGADHSIKFWTWKAKKSPQAGIVARGHHQPISCLTPLGETAFATASWDGTVKLWDLRDGGSAEDRFTLLGHNGPVRALAAASNRQLLASAGHDGTIRLWRASPAK